MECVLRERALVHQRGQLCVLLRNLPIQIAHDVRLVLFLLRQLLLDYGMIREDALTLGCRM